MAKKLILYFDELQSLRKVKAELEKFGFVCEGVTNLPDLHQRLSQFSADGILISLTNPSMNIREDSQKLREISALGGKVIVLLPSRISNEELLQLQIDALIEENCPAEKLVRILQKLFGQLTSPSPAEPSAISPALARQKRFEKGLIKPPDFNGNAMIDHARAKTIAASDLFDSKPEFQEDRRQFAERLFKRK